ncbi:MAG: ribonuclease P protein component [Deltaproteobacteria bacterium]
MFSPRKFQQNKAMSHVRLFRFKKSQRILKSEEFKSVLQGGLRREIGHFILFFLPNGRSENRMGTIITRKVGQATKRNAIKRRLREYFRSYHADIVEDLPSHDVVFIAKRNSRVLKPKMIGQEMREFYEKNRDFIHKRLSTNRIGSSAQ